MKEKTLNEILEEGVKKLEEAKIEEAKLDAWYLFSYSFGLDKVKFLIEREQIALKQNKIEDFFNKIEKRKKHIPLQYILGEQEFMGLSFLVDKNVLIPRQDTEILVEEVRKTANKKSILDIGTGSGCIIISIAKLETVEKAVGADISKQALEIAKKNAERNNVCIDFIQSNLFENINEKYDIIVSNPPYIETDEIYHLMPEVKDHEPFYALDGGTDGLSFYRDIILNAKRYLKEKGSIFLEIGCSQAGAVFNLLKKQGFISIKVKKDLAGLDRVISAKVP